MTPQEIAKEIKQDPRFKLFETEYTKTRDEFNLFKRRMEIKYNKAPDEHYTMYSLPVNPTAKQIHDAQTMLKIGDTPSKVVRAEASEVTEGKELWEKLLHTSANMWQSVSNIVGGKNLDQLTLEKVRNNLMEMQKKEEKPAIKQNPPPMNPIFPLSPTTLPPLSQAAQKSALRNT